jgi:hypothetical protein
MKMYLLNIKIKDCRNRTHLKEECICTKDVFEDAGRTFRRVCLNHFVILCFFSSFSSIFIFILGYTDM